MAWAIAIARLNAGRGLGRLLRDVRKATFATPDRAAHNTPDAESRIAPEADRVEPELTADPARPQHLISPLTRTIILINLVGLLLLVGGVLALSNYRQGLVDARLSALATEGELIAGALVESALIEPEGANPLLQFDISSAVPILRRMALASGTRIRLYDTKGQLIIDTRALLPARQVQSYRLLPPDSVFGTWPALNRLYDWVIGRLPSLDLPAYEEHPKGSGAVYEEVRTALLGESGQAVRVGGQGQVVVGIGVPVQRLKVVQGALFLTSEGGATEQMLRAERLRILQLFLVALAVSILLSVALASTIGRPIRQLAASADRVRLGHQGRVTIARLKRSDEIGDLAGALADMTAALYARMDATERFAADVTHEIKNPLTSIRSAIETLDRTDDATRRERLHAIIKHDVGRLDRLISDISDASRLDAELARERMETVDLPTMLRTLVTVNAETHGTDMRLSLKTGPRGDEALQVHGLAERLGQVFRNLIDNARSFNAPDAPIEITAWRADQRVMITVEDCGPGIPEENLESIFARFYTARPGAEQFGKHSGLGLAIARQIVEAHRGTIVAENRRDATGHITGARFVVTLPARGAHG